MDNQLEDDSLRDREPVKLFQNGGDSIQILTALSAMVKTTTPEVIPGAFYFPRPNNGFRPAVFS